MVFFYATFLYKKEKVNVTLYFSLAPFILLSAFDEEAFCKEVF